MQFAYPWLLTLLILPIAVGLWQRRHGGVEAALPFDFGNVASGRRVRFWVDLASWLPLAAAAAGIVLLARPQRLLVGQTEREVRNLQFLVDVSGSMRIKYGSARRFDAAMKAVADFVDKRKGDAFAFSVFGGELLPWLPLTRDGEAIKHAAAFVDPDAMPGSMADTYIGNALRKTMTRLTDVPGDRTVILITDGQSGDLGRQRTAVLARQLKSAHVVVFGVFIGADESTEDLGTIARETGGAMFRAGDPAALAETFRRIDAMQPAKFKPLERTSVDWPLPAALVGLVTLTLHAGCAFGLRYTPW